MMPDIETLMLWFPELNEKQTLRLSTMFDSIAERVDHELDQYGHMNGNRMDEQKVYTKEDIMKAVNYVCGKEEKK